MAKMNSMMNGTAFQNGINPQIPQLQGLFSFLNNNPAFQRAIMPSQGFMPSGNPFANATPFPKPNIPMGDAGGGMRTTEPVAPIAPSNDLLSKLAQGHRGFNV